MHHEGAVFEGQRRPSAAAKQRAEARCEAVRCMGWLCPIARNPLKFVDEKRSIYGGCHVTVKILGATFENRGGG
jgi:hypothetical protein